MEQTCGYQYRLEKLSKAIRGLETALRQGEEKVSDDLLDTIHSGQVQKFEVCVELLWKTLKAYLSDVKGLEEKSPKSVLKAFYRESSIPEDLYESIVQALNERNFYSHVYDEVQFETLRQRLPEHAAHFRAIEKVLLKSD